MMCLHVNGTFHGQYGYTSLHWKYHPIENVRLNFSDYLFIDLSIDQIPYDQLNKVNKRQNTMTVLMPPKLTKLTNV
jgi:hypothetical protein